MNALVYTGLYDTAKRAYLKQVSMTEQERAQDIVKTICDTLKISVEDVESQWRKREVTLCRHVCIHFVKYKTKLSLKAIGQLLGGRDHSTVIYGLETYDDILETDKSFRELMIKMESILTGSKEYETA